VAFSVARSTTGEQVSDAIREDILRGELKPGTRIVESTLARSSDISRGAVREALRILANEGLVVYRMHKGVSVADPTVDDVREIYAIRRRIESWAIEAAVPSAPEIQGLRDAVDAHLAAGLAGSYREANESHFLFHRRLVALLGQERLTRFYSGLLTELALCFSITAQIEDQADLAGQHLPLIEYLARGERILATTLLLNQLQQGEEVLVSVLARLHQA
jgi:DNA-binding GntR family transcriptional regulator